MSGSTSATTRVVLVRHGHVEGIDPPRFRGRIDLPLTLLGIRQAERTRDLLAPAFRPAAAYASPLSRCITTAEVIVQPAPIPIVPTPGFVDMDYGEWQGKTYEEVRQSDPRGFEQWFRAPHLVVIPGGETFLDATTRVTETMSNIIAAHCNETILLVGHESVNRLLLLLALGLPLSRFWDLRQAPGAVNLVTHDGVHGWTVESMNESTHLRSLR